MDMRGRLKAVVMTVVALALGGVLLNGVMELMGDGRDPADYPRCVEIVRNLGSSPDALCANGDDVIELQDYSLYDTYHPAG